MNEKFPPNLAIAKNGSILKSILNRRDLRTFEQKPISKKIIEELLYSATWAPNHKLTEPWRFKIIKEESKPKLIHCFCQGLKSLNYSAESLQKKQEKAHINFPKIPLFIAISSQVHQDSQIDKENLLTVACGIQNMLLLAQEKGIYAHWSSGVTWTTSSMVNFLKLTPNEHFVAMLQMGFATQINLQKMKRSSFQNFTEWV